MGTLEALNDMQILSGKFPCDVISENGIQEAGMEIRPFHTSHDSAESVGYRISLPNGRVVVVATDLGFVSGGYTLDAAGVCVDDALRALYELTGENAGDDVIDEVFSRFCVGK